MRLIFLLIIPYIFEFSNEVNLIGTWSIAEHYRIDSYGHPVKNTYNPKRNFPMTVFFIQRDSIVIICGDGKPGKFSGHFNLDKNNNVKCSGFGDDRNMMSEIAIEFNRKASKIKKLKAHNDTLKFFLNTDGEVFTFIRIDTIKHTLDECNMILSEVYK